MHTLGANKMIDAPPNKHFEISINLELTMAEDNLRGMDPYEYEFMSICFEFSSFHFSRCSRRGCYFENDRELSMYRHYTLNNCLMECVSAIQMDMMKCTHVKYPRPKTSRICNATELKIFTNRNHSIVENNIYNTGKGKQYPECGCLPLCNQIEYDFQTVSTNEVKINPENSM